MKGKTKKQVQALIKAHILAKYETPQKAARRLHVSVSTVKSYWLRDKVPKAGLQMIGHHLRKPTIEIYDEDKKD